MELKDLQQLKKYGLTDDEIILDGIESSLQPFLLNLELL